MITRAMAAQQAALLRCEPAAVLAVAEVESANSGFLSDGRPAILFEAQVFHNETGGIWDASHPDISSPTWNRALYRGGAAEYDRLAEAMQLDVVHAWESASWGAFQIMGFNYKACGFASVSDFVNAMKGPIENHLAAFDSFIRANPALLQALRAKDWTAFARGYNGPGAVAQYAAKISTAYQIHARQDAELAAAPAPVIVVAAPIAPPPPRAPDPQLEAMVPPPPAELAPPVFEGPPIPAADPSAPPPGHVETASGNIVRTDPADSTIVKGADQGKLIAIATAAGTAGTAATSIAGMDWKLVLALAGLALAGSVAAFVWFVLIKGRRLDMSKQGIA